MAKLYPAQLYARRMEGLGPNEGSRVAREVYNELSPPCENCGVRFAAYGRKKFCSNACKQAAYRARKEK